MTPATGSDGFSILETLVGLLILSLALAVFAQVVATSARSISTANERSNVKALLSELQAEVVPELKRGAGLASGTSRGMDWVVERRLVPAVHNIDNEPAFYMTTITGNGQRQYRFIDFGVRSK